MADCQPALLTGSVLERGATKGALLTSCQELAALAGRKQLDKTEVPLMATAGVGGSGKSTVLNLIRFGIRSECWQPNVLAAIQLGCSKVNKLVVMMATLNQRTPLQAYEDPTHAILGRLFADCTMSDWDPKHALRLPQEIASWRGLANWVRNQNSPDGNVDQVAVMFLVDEIRRMDAHFDSSMKSDVLDQLAAFQQEQLSEGLVSLVLVTSLDVSTFSSFTRESKRPVKRVPLPQLTLGDGLGICRAELERTHTADIEGPLADKIRANIAFALSMTGGHLRTVEAVMKHGNFASPFNFRGACFDSEAFLRIIIKQWQEPGCWFARMINLGGHPFESWQTLVC